MDSGRLKLAGQRVQLREIEQRDYPLLRQIETSDEDRLTYRLRGATLRPEDYAESLWSGVLAQFVVCSRETGEVWGLVACYSPDLVNRHAKLAEIVIPRVRGTGVAAEAMYLFVTFLFRAYPLQKLYIDVLDVNAPAFEIALARLFRKEAHLSKHAFVDGIFVDQYTYALYPSDLSELEKRLAWSSEEGTRLRPAGWSGFLHLIESLELHLPPDVSPEARLDDLGFDSLLVWECVAAIEGDSVLLPEDLVSATTTLDDLFHLYSIAAPNNESQYKPTGGKS